MDRESIAASNEETNGESLLVSDVHFAQKTENVSKRLKDRGTTSALIPPGCTSLIQPLDVVFNITFEQKCGDLFTKHIKANLPDYTENKLAASQRRVLITKWVGQVWQKMSSTMERTII